MKLWEYVDKKVKVTFIDGQVIKGNVEFYTSALDNEPEPESITLRNNSTNFLTELFRTEIAKIEVIE